MKPRIPRPEPKLDAARPDGRPLYFDMSPGPEVECCKCSQMGLIAKYSRPNAFMNDPANSPMDDQGVYFMCLAHLPDNAVIYDPTTDLCRDKTGQNVWTETTELPTAGDI